MVNNYTHSNRREKWGIGVLGELLQELRKDKGMTQAELAAKLELYLHMSVGAVHRMMKRK